MLLRSSACPACGGCLPGDGPDALVCTCGAAWKSRPAPWAADMAELIGVLARLLAHPGPADPTPTTPEEHA
jgi:hypothetical protein